MLEIVYLSFVTASISFTITETKLFERIRNFFNNRSVLLGRLLNCGYCIGHWVAFLLVAIYRPRLFSSFFFLIDYFLTALVIAWISAFQWIVLYYFMKITEK
jgi:hypothetical protein